MCTVSVAIHCQWLEKKDKGLKFQATARLTLIEPIIQQAPYLPRDKMVPQLYMTKNYSHYLYCKGLYDILLYIAV